MIPEPEFVPENWEPYRGNNHLPIPPIKVACGGSVSFARHLGKPLTPELWKDLVHRLCIRGLCIYKPHDAQWTIGWGEGHCCIDLDESALVADIHFVPYTKFPARATDVARVEENYEMRITGGPK